MPQLYVYMYGDTERGHTMRTPDARTIDPNSRASTLAREMEEAASRYAQMTEQIDSVLRADRLRRRDAWTHGTKGEEAPGPTPTPARV